MRFPFRMFGVQIYVADFVGIGMVKAMGHAMAGLSLKILQGFRQVRKGELLQ
jgi:hypothetical protein